MNIDKICIIKFELQLRMWDQPVISVLRYVTPELSSPTKLACFDLDWTLTRPIKSRLPKGIEDQALLPGRQHTLQYLSDNGWTLVVFTNQKSGNETRKKLNHERVDYFIRKLGLPIVVLMSLKEDEYRKPSEKLWNLLPFIVPKEQCFYIGDAAGRPGDFADTDKLFASNVGIKFEVPEKFFPPVSIPIQDEGKRLIILMGMQGSGKSTFYTEKLSQYIHLSQDELGTKPKVITALKKALISGSPIVIDATNPSKEGRRTYISMAIEAGYIVDIIHIVRNGYDFNKLRAKPVPDIAYNVYFSKLEEPTLEEVNGTVYEFC